VPQCLNFSEQWRRLLRLLATIYFLQILAVLNIFGHLSKKIGTGIFIVGGALIALQVTVLCLIVRRQTRVATEKNTSLRAVSRAL